VVAGLYHAGFSYADIARQTGLSVDRVRKDVALGEQHFHLADRLSKVVMRLDNEAVPLAVDHLIATLESTDKADVGRKDEAMYRTLAGRGAFRTYTQDDGAGRAPTTMALQVQFTTPPGGLTATALTAQVVGASRPEADPAPAPAPPLRLAGVPHATTAGRDLPSDYTD
jgi:hypothetical protein